ncbi:MAG: hypothetical protein ACREGB_01780 [Candidatus Saccharimonadales bacterium]
MFNSYVYDLNTSSAGCPDCAEQCGADEVVETGDMFGYNYKPKEKPSAQGGNVFGYDPKEEAEERAS